MVNLLLTLLSTNIFWPHVFLQFIKEKCILIFFHFNSDFPFHKMQAVWTPKGGVMVLGVSCVESRDWAVLLYRVIVIRGRRNIQNAEFYEVNFGKESRLTCLSHIQRCRSFSGQDETVFEWFCLKAWEISKFMLVLTREQISHVWVQNYENPGKNL